MVSHGSPTQPLARGGAIPLTSRTLKNMHSVYLLKSLKDKRFYIGSTSDLKLRMLDHESGSVKSTKHRRPLQLIYFEAYPSKQAAAERERQLKKFGSAYTGLMKRLGYK